MASVRDIPWMKGMLFPLAKGQRNNIFSPGVDGVTMFVNCWPTLT